MAGKDDQYFLITRALEMLRLKEKYLNSFQAQCVEDGVVKDCLSQGLDSVLTAIISSKEDRELFAQAFERAYEENKSFENVPDQTRNETVETVPEVERVAGRTDRKVWTEIAERHGIEAKTEFGVKKMLQAKALEVQKRVYKVSFDTAVTGEQVEGQIRAGAAAALEFLTEALAPVEAKIKDVELDKLKRALGPQEEYLKKDDGKRIAEARKLLEDYMDEIGSKYQWYMERELGDDANVDTGEYMEVHDQVVEVLLEELEMRCGSNPFFSEQAFKDRMALHLNGYLKQPETTKNNAEVQSKTAKLAADLTKMYHQRLEQVVQLDSFDACHNETVAFLEDAMKYVDLDDEDRTSSWNTFLNTLDEAEKSAKAQVESRAAKRKEEQAKAPAFVEQPAELNNEQAEAAAKLEKEAAAKLEKEAAAKLEEEAAKRKEEQAKAAALEGQAAKLKREQAEATAKLEEEAAKRKEEQAKAAALEEQAAKLKKEQAEAAAKLEKEAAKRKEEQAKAAAELRKQVAELEKRASKALEQLVALYKRKTDATFAQTITLTKADAAFLDQHQSVKKEVLKKLPGELLPHGEPKTPIEEEKLDEISLELEQELDFIVSQALEQNRVRWTALQTGIEALYEEHVDSYVQEMYSLAKTARNEAELDRKEGRVRATLLKQFQAKLGNLVRDKDHIKQATEKLERMFDSEKDGCLEELHAQKRENNLLYKAGMAEAKKYYIEEMERNFFSREWWNTSELRHVHDQVLSRALESSRESVALSETAEQNLRKGFEVIFEGYLEKNLLRTPNLEPAIGIDLGTTYSCVGVYYNGAVQIIPNLKSDGKTTVASYVAFNEGGRISIGNEAKESAFQNPINTIFDAKRLIGRKFDDPEVQQDMRLWPFEVIGEKNEPRIKVKDQTFRPEEISARVLAYLKNIAEAHLKVPVRKAVITVPAYFEDGQRKATKDAAEIAGLEASIINEPTAAALAYQLNRTGDAEKNVLVFDLGGGTFDVVVISMDFGKVDVKAVNGDTHLGGEDFDNAIVDALVERVRQKFNIDLARGRNSNDSTEKLAACTRLRRLKSACEEQKRLLSETKQVKIRIDLLDGDFSLNETFTRDEFNAINATRFQRCIQVVEQALKEAKLSKSDVDDVVLVGGSTRIPKVQQLLKEYFGDKQSFCRRINADEAVAYGAAFQAALMHGSQVQGNLRNMIVKDATPHSLGIEVLSKELSVILEKNTPIPCSRTQDYVTAEDGQTRIKVVVFEGEQRIARDNTLLGSFYINNIPPKPAGREGIDCTMTIDSEGILHVEAVSKSQGTKEKIVIQEHRGRMSSEEKKVAKTKPMFVWK